MKQGVFSEGRKILTVCELTLRLRTEIELAFSDLWIAGEVANLKIPSSGHCYFTLKDANAQVRAIIFRSQGRFLKFIPKEGLAVLIRGHLTVYEAKGEYQLIVDYIEPRGAGALQAAFEALKENLMVEGLFHEERKKPIPIFPGKIGLITSPTGAVLQDMLAVLKSLPISILVFPVAVQGEGAAEEIAKAIDTANAPNRSVDLLILARGGGSLEDLWAFNEEIVARAIARSSIPIISAVGHETDTTIADFVADVRAPTPSIAAEMILKNVTAVIDRFNDLKNALHALIHRRIRHFRFDLTVKERLLASPERQIRHLREQVGHLSIRLRQSVHFAIAVRQGRLFRCRQGLIHLNPIAHLKKLNAHLLQQADRIRQMGEKLIAQRKTVLASRMAQLHLLSPLNILKRGYSITRSLPALEVIRDIREVGLYDRLQILLHRGKIRCLVEGLEPPASSTVSNGPTQ